MNLASRFNLSPQAAAYVAKTMGEEAPPASPPPSLDDYVAQNLPPTEASPPIFSQLRAEGSPVQDAQKFVTDVYEGKRPLIPEGSPNEGAQQSVTFQGPRKSDFPDFNELSGDDSETEEAASPGVFVAPHWQGSTRTEKVEKGIDPSAFAESRGVYDLSHVNKVRAADARYDAARITAAADEEYARAGVLAEEQAQAARNALAQKRDAFVASETRKLESLSQAAQKKIDPDDFWKSRGGAGGRVFAAIAAALGQFGASLTGGTNTAWQIIQSGIDDNIRAQQENASRAERSYDRARSVYEQNLAALGDPHQAYVATKMQYLDQVKTMLGEQYAKAKTKEAEAAYHDLLAAAEGERGNLLRENEKLSADKFTLESGERFVPGGMVGGGGGGEKDRGPLYVPSLGGYARSEEAAKALNAKAAINSQIVANMRRVYDLLGEAESLSSVTDHDRLTQIRQQIKAIGAHTMQLHNVGTGMGAMSKDDAEVTENALGFADIDPKFMTQASIKRARKTIYNLAATRLENFRIEGEMMGGIRKGKETYRRGPDGKMIPVSVLEGRNTRPSKRTTSYGDVLQDVKGSAK